MSSVQPISTHLSDFLSTKALSAPAASAGNSPALPGAAATSQLKSGNGVSSALSGAENELGRDAFLELLVMQMQHQDPLEPTDNSEMIAQLAQFSALEQMENLNDSFQEFAGNMDQNNFISASNLLGHEITGLDINGNPVEGIVDGVTMDGSVVYMSVGEQVVSMAGVMSISLVPDDAA